MAIAPHDNVIRQLANIDVWQKLLCALLAAAFYCLSLAFLLDALLQESYPYVTRAFVGVAWKVLILAALVVFLTAVLLFRARRKKVFSPQITGNSIKPADAFLVLLPLTPIIQYVLNNQDILSLTGNLIVIGVFAGFTVVISLIVPTLFTSLGIARTLMVTGIAFAFTITDMASLSASQEWFELGKLHHQLAKLTVVFLTVTLAYEIVGRKFAYAVVGIYFVFNTSQNYPWIDNTEERSSAKDWGNGLTELVGARTPVSTPNIYLLIYDAYVANETMLGYGIDNTAQEEYLVQAGFRLYPHTYSVAAFSVGTMSRVLSVTSSYYEQPRTAVSGDAPVQGLLRGFGYKTHGVFTNDYFFQADGSSYDNSFPKLQSTQAFRGSRATHWMLIKAILMGEFRFDVEFGSPSHEEFLEYKGQVLGKAYPSPKFVYVHENHPGHSQNSGKCRSNETALFADRLKIANDEMRNDIALLARDDPGAIVIVAGDHGPYLTKNCTDTGHKYKSSEISRLDVQDRYGTFLAIKWPSNELAQYDQIVTLQDLFPAILAGIFDDPQFLRTRIVNETLRLEHTSNVSVSNGIIKGGANDGEPLFLSHLEQKTR